MEKAFVDKLGEYKQLIDTDIASYAAELERVTREKYGASAHIASDAYLQILKRGGKRIRGALVMLGYEMSEGTDQAMILQAARAIEMFHAHMLVIDDIQDRSLVRRGGPTAHKQLEAYHQAEKFTGEAAHFGTAVAINGALSGLHAAETILTQLDVSPEKRLGVIRLVNDTLLTTVHGQSHDIANELLDTVSMSDVEQVMELKTANYSILNPLQVGMVLAGADADDLAAITDYAMHVGKAFQTTDDIIGTFGKSSETHKDPMDDIREGKRTMLTVYTLEHAATDDRALLLSCLGNNALAPSDFERCRDIIDSCGALGYAKTAASQHIAEALESLDDQAYRWAPEDVVFLRNLATYILGRTT